MPWPPPLSSYDDHILSISYSTLLDLKEVNMQLWHSALRLCLLVSAIPAQAASAWGFTDATVSVQTKGAGVGSGLKQQYVLAMDIY